MRLVTPVLHLFTPGLRRLRSPQQSSTQSLIQILLPFPAGSASSPSVYADLSAQQGGSAGALPSVSSTHSASPGTASAQGSSGAAFKPPHPHQVLRANGASPNGMSAITAHLAGGNGSNSQLPSPLVQPMQPHAQQYLHSPLANPHQQQHFSFAPTAPMMQAINGGYAVPQQGGMPAQAYGREGIFSLAHLAQDGTPLSPGVVMYTMNPAIAAQGGYQIMPAHAAPHHHQQQQTVLAFQPIPRHIVAAAGSPVPAQAAAYTQGPSSTAPAHASMVWASAPAATSANATSSSHAGAASKQTATAPSAARSTAGGSGGDSNNAGSGGAIRSSVASAAAANTNTDGGVSGPAASAPNAPHQYQGQGHGAGAGDVVEYDGSVRASGGVQTEVRVVEGMQVGMLACRLAGITPTRGEHGAWASICVVSFCARRHCCLFSHVQTFSVCEWAPYARAGTDSSPFRA